MSDAPVVYPLREPMKDYFKLNNWIADVGIKELSGHAVKLFIYIYRETVGRGNPGGREMSNRELLLAGNVRSYSTVQASIVELQSKQYVIVTKKGQWDTVHYRVNSEMEKPITATESVAKTRRYENRSATETVVDSLQKVKRRRYIKCSAVATETVDMIKTEDRRQRKDIHTATSSLPFEPDSQPEGVTQRDPRPNANLIHWLEENARGIIKRPASYADWLMNGRFKNGIVSADEYLLIILQALHDLGPPPMEKPAFERWQSELNMAMSNYRATGTYISPKEKATGSGANGNGRQSTKAEQNLEDIFAARQARHNRESGNGINGGS